MKGIQKIYLLNKSNKVGDSCVCPSCGNEFVKDNYQQAFCRSRSKTKCKDKYWNTVTPNKRNNKTRISPASKRFLARQKEVRDYHNDINDYHNREHPHSSEALGQWD